MLKYLNLQLFAEGGDGAGDAGGTSADGGSRAEASGDEIPAFIPEKARGVYKKAMEIEKAKKDIPKPETEPVTETKDAHIAYTDLIKSDEYKEEHKAYMDKTIADRLKKYKDIEKTDKRMKDVLSVVAQKYNLDPNSDDYLDKLTEAVNSDDAYVENYAMEHDLSNDEARRQIDMQRRLDGFEREKAMREEQEARDFRTRRLFDNAEKCKAIYPGFDLETEMRNERFVTLCQATNEDVIAAYEVIHRDELKALQSQALAQRAQQQIANSVASNASRPIENGLSNQASAVVSTDFSRMNLAQIRAFAEEQRRKQR